MVKDEDLKSVGSTANKASRKKININDMFAELTNGRKKDKKLPIKSSKRNHLALQVTKKDKTVAQDLENFDESLIDDMEDDEFDSMIDSGGLSQKLGISKDSELLAKPKKVECFDDGLSDDEEYQNMSQEERNEKMKPNLNMDGMPDGLESSDEDSRELPAKRQRCDSTNESFDLPDIDVPLVCWLSIYSLYSHSVKNSNIL